MAAPAPIRRVKDALVIVAGCTASLNVAVTLVVWLCSTALAAGVRAITVGLVTSGAVGGTAAERDEKAPPPSTLTARTWNRTAAPLVSPVTSRLIAAAPAGRRAPTWPLAALTTRTS